MARTLTPERQELAGEALELRRAGLTQQQIADVLGVPRITILNWLMNNPLSGIVNNSTSNVHNSENTNVLNSITLYQGALIGVVDFSKTDIDLKNRLIVLR